MLGMNETKPMTRNIAMLKARQAASTGRRTRLVRDMVAAGEWGLGLLELDKDTYCPIAGGVPVYSQDQVLLGGCGVSNLHEDEDEKVWIHAVEACNFVSDLG